MVSIQLCTVAMAEFVSVVVVIPVVGQSVSINWILVRRLVNKVISCSGPVLTVEKAGVTGMTGVCRSGK